LGARLIRRGLAPAAVLLALELLPKTVGAVPVRLVEATVWAAARVAAGERALRGEVPMRVADLEGKVRKAMQLTRLKWASAFALAVAVTGAGVAVVPRALAVVEDTAKVKAELKKLQGTWVDISIEKPGAKRKKVGEQQLKIDGETFTLSHDGNVEDKGTIKLDPSRSPGEIDFQIREGKNEGKTGLGIYAWDGEHLKLCLGSVEAGTRPKDFTSMPEDRILIVLKRQSP
jgi:uncharacterized protein (TIGR03067 family)